MKSDYRVRARHFMEVLWDYIEDCHNFWDYKQAITRFNREKNRKVKFSHGVARIALITSDYVIKFDYDLSEVARVGGCEDEVQFYAFAQDMGFGYLFAEITPFYFHGRMFYIMPRVEGIGRYKNCWVDRFLESDEYEFCSNYLEDLHDDNYGWYKNHPIIIDYACNQFSINREYDDDYCSSYHEDDNYDNDDYEITTTDKNCVVSIPWGA